MPKTSRKRYGCCWAGEKNYFVMRRKNLIAAAVAVLCLTSCSAIFYGSGNYSEYGETFYSNDDVKIGDSKRSILEKYGKPYTQELELVDGKTVETLGYKESMRYGYRVNTFFVFEDGKLIKKIQTEEKPRPEIKVNNKD